MAIGLTAEHQELAAAVRGWAERLSRADGTRDPGADVPVGRPPLADALAEQGLLGLHLPEAYGGQGAGLLELAVALEELGRGLLPGPFLPTVLASAVIAHSGDDTARAELLPGLADGTRTAALALGPPLSGRRSQEGVHTVVGTLAPVLGGHLADVIVAPVRDEAAADTWVVLDAAGLDTAPLPSLDPDRAVATVRAEGTAVPPGSVLSGLATDDVRAIAAVLIGAEATGIAAWALDTAVAYARTREQFGGPIGRFQGVKHKCARMAIAVEQARAAVWDAARAIDADVREAAPAAPAPDSACSHFATAVAALIAPDNALACTRDCIQVHGGIGFTWEHDAHRYLRRAATLRALAGSAPDWAVTVADAALAGRRRPVEIELDDAESTDARRAIRAEVARLAAVHDQEERFRAMADGGLVAPHLPRPWGRDASPREQLIIQQELKRAGVRGPTLAIGAWVLPSIAGYGTPEQQERFLRPTLRGEVMWCQLFSEPGAGSDLAALSMRAERVAGGYRLTGQKIWTSIAHIAQWGICLARTDPGAAGKHDGITYFVVDMSSPGIEVRPLRELTGDTIFNEVFFDDVFVPEDCVVGEPGEGWKVARNTLTNERVALSSGSGIGVGLPELVAFFTEDPGRAADRDVRVELGRLVAQGQAIELLGLRVALKQVSGTEPGAESSVRKLQGVEFSQRAADFIWERQGSAAACADPEGATGARARDMLFGRSMTIYGGTTEVQLNIIGERLLGLPRDPEA
ncbi:alkylation response protein AidB-like acyl-CoA dehydrogenase [Nocardiopsis mwathae]|uniref:Alkylation response protein AidB-like acyl-CoA dehydrogenase n=1 Tax=Nocardiopsis mwathae TaxID=1472723 RepID=A0A7X0D3G8_9ACTN|nr:acyl-CoA dehydrogenase [Nocardiopsis mwathae]MBB6170177.1 alkylation response protein AidB-like acyl-CoA dehydrogenase [Nocardiopsis mwathae]